MANQAEQNWIDRRKKKQANKQIERILVHRILKWSQTNLKIAGFSVRFTYVMFKDKQQCKFA